MKTSFSAFALTGALLLAGFGGAPASAQSASDQVVRTLSPAAQQLVDGPQTIQYSWGIHIASIDDNDQRSYTWTELRDMSRIAQASAQTSATGNVSPARSASVGAAVCPAQVQHDITGPQAIQYSWGVQIFNSGDSHQPSYTWSQLQRLGCELPNGAGK